VPAYLRLNEAHDWREFVTALRDYVVPSQNFVYADVNGHIGYYAPGHFPIRASGDGSRPAEGWSGEAEWTGWIPFEELPHIYDPPAHFIVTANHRPVPPAYPYVLGLEWPEPYRARRITELIAERVGSGAKLTLDDSARIQADTFSQHARALLPLLLAHAHPQGSLEEQAVAALRSWNMNATADSVPEAVFEAWFYQLAPTLVADELGPVVTDTYKRRLSYVTRFVVNTLTRNNSAWCDDRTTSRQETCDDAVTEALRRGLRDLSSRMGSDMSRWRWDTVHHAIFPHQGLDTVAVLRPFLSRSVPNGGDWSTVDVGSVVAEQPFEQHAVPGFREIIDLSEARDDRFADAVGESGHPLSPHYDDYLTDWRAVRYRRMRTDRSDIEQGAIGHLTLVPK
jgi:penicillin amidase